MLATGGATTRDGTDTANAVKEAELWDPISETWTTLAGMQVPRLYHSIAMVLPDGRVLVAGSGQDTGVIDQFDIEIFSPPYLFKGPRPSITSAPQTLAYGSSFFVETLDNASITSVSLIKTSAVTHFFNQDQRFINLNFSQAPGGLTVQAPTNNNLATPGIYMLFLVNSNGVPSVAPFVTLPSPLDDTQLIIEMSQASYVNGETVTASTFRLANPTAEPVVVELKVWIGTPIPGLPVVSMFNVGADGSFVVPAGLDADFGPFPVFPVGAGLPRGSYEFSSRILHWVTGELLSEDLNPFAIE